MDELIISNDFSFDSDVVLFEGDTRNLISHIPDNSMQLIVTSPPYNLGKVYEERIDVKDYQEQQAEIINACVRKLKPSGSICWQVGNYVKDGEIIPIDILLFPIFANLHLHLRNRIIWHFGHGLHASKRFSGRYEVILWFTKSDEYKFNLDAVRVPQKYPSKKYFKGPKRGELSGNPLGKNPSDIWEIPNVKANHVEKTIHPCQFPVELVERLVLALSDEGDWVFDPFMGVGSTAIAAVMHKRKTIGAEIKPEYINIARDRIYSAQNGQLRVRPIERPVYEPNGQSKSIPPKFVNLHNTTQPRLLEPHKKYEE